MLLKIRHPTFKNQRQIYGFFAKHSLQIKGVVFLFQRKRNVKTRRYFKVCLHTAFICPKQPVYAPTPKLQLRTHKVYQNKIVTLHKLGGARQYKNKLSLLSFALTLHKLGGARQYKNKLSLLSFALTLHKLGGARQYKNKLSLPSFALTLQKRIQ